MILCFSLRTIFFKNTERAGAKEIEKNEKGIHP